MKTTYDIHNTAATVIRRYPAYDDSREYTAQYFLAKQLDPRRWRTAYRAIAKLPAHEFASKLYEAILSYPTHKVSVHYHDGNEWTSRECVSLAWQARGIICDILHDVVMCDRIPYDMDCGYKEVVKRRLIAYVRKDKPFSDLLNRVFALQSEYETLAELVHACWVECYG